MKHQPAAGPPRNGNPLARRLGALSPLGEGDCAALAGLLADQRWIGPGKDLLAEGAPPCVAWVVLEGMACRCKVEGGRRQIIALMLPGDFCGVGAADQCILDHSVRTLTRCRVAMTDRPTIEAFAEDRPAIAEALDCEERVQGAILRTWLFNLGQKTAHERLAHLICELIHRFGELGLLYQTGAFRLPVSQEVLGEVIGVGRVQASRALQRLKSEHLIDVHGGVVLAQDLRRLAALARFDPAYLRPCQRPRSMVALASAF